jgi:uncharacterized protein YfaS (alpha-2-macroglobulin family)
MLKKTKRIFSLNRIFKKDLTPKTSNMLRYKHSYPFFLLLLLLTSFSCQQKQNNRQLSAETNQYIYGFTSGTISKNSPVIINFTQSVTDDLDTPPSTSLFSLSPEVPGTLSWEDERTLRFDPSSSFKAGTQYTASVNLQKLIAKLPKNTRSFQFDFRIREQFFEVLTVGLQTPNPQQLSSQVFSGSIITADEAEPDEVESVLSAVQNNANLPIEWEHLEGQNEHRFLIKNIQRSDAASEVQLNWKGEKMGVQMNGSQSLEIPALGDFKVTDVQSIQSPEQYLSIRFSDPIKEDQNLNGLLSLAGNTNDLRYLIEGQEIRVFPANRLEGQQTVFVDAAIRNSLNARLGSESRWTVRFEAVKPAVRLVGSGVILPNSDGLYFPFEAIGLTTVDVEIFKIYHNNILQFLQTNQLGGSSSLRQVGRVALRESVPLRTLNPSGQAGKWTRYALDLSQMIEQDPQAIYQVRIGFQPAYTNYTCSEGNISDFLEPIEAEVDDDGEINSMMDSWYGIAGYYQGYRWTQRDDPCYTAYYNTDQFISRNVIASNLGIIAKGSDNKDYFVVVSDLRTTLPRSNAKVAFYDYQQQLIGETTTNAQGVARLQLSKKPFVVMTEHDADVGYLRLEDGDALSMSRFDVSGAVTQKGLKGFLYAERGVWRPGDSIYLNFMLEKEDGVLPANYPITFEVIDPRGQVQEQFTSSENINALYPLHFKTASAAPTGNWLARVKAGGATFTKTIQVETIQPNRLSIKLDFGRESLRQADEPQTATLNAKWLHGAPASGLKAKVEVQLQASNTTFEQYPNYEFDDPARRIQSATKTIFDGQLDNNGNARIQNSLYSNNTAPGKLRATFKTRVFEKGGNFSTDVKSLPYLPYREFTGVAIPENKYGEKRLDIGKDQNISFVLLDENGNPVPNRSLSVGLYRVEWRWWWDSNNDNVSRYNSSSHFNAQETVSLTTNSEGQANWSIKVDDWGRYMVRICDEEGGHCSGDFFYAGYPWYGDEGSNRQAAAMLNFISDKNTYQVGEQVTLSIPTGESGKALITLENGSTVLDQYWIETERGETQFTFATDERMSPNVYAHVALLQPHAQTVNDLPIRMYGVLPVEVDDPATILHPVLAMNDELRPEENFTVQVSETDGQAMTYTLAVVDEGLLGLTRFQTPDPHASFYAREALGVRTWDVYDQVLGAFGSQMNRVLSIGGDGEVGVEPEDTDANRFEPVVMHLGPFQLEKGKKAKHEITMPNYVGAVRTMVVASSSAGAYGHAEKTTPVRKPLMVLATLPRVLGPGEQLKLPVNIFTSTDQVKTVTIEVTESSGLARISGEATKTITMDQPGQQLVAFDVDVDENVGVAKFSILARGGGETARQDIEILVRNPNPYTTDIQAKVLDPGQDWSGTVKAIGMTGTNEGMLEISTIPPLNLEKRLDFILEYPYGCIEQTTSSGFPQLYVNRLIQMSEEQQQEQKNNIVATINRIKQFQTTQGGFAYWPGGDRPNHWGTNYAGHFLLEAKANGYTVPVSLINKWADFQKKAARLWRSDLEEYGFYSIQSNQLNQAYRLFTLAVAGKPELSAMNRMLEMKDLSIQAQWRLAAAYATIGKTEVAQRIVDGLTTNIQDYRELGSTYGSAVRDQAMILETLLLLGNREQAANVVKYISDQLSSQSWYSTQTTAYSLMAVCKFIGEGDALEPMRFAYQVGSDEMKDGGSSEYPLMQIVMPVERRNGEQISLRNEGSAPLFIRLIQRGQPLTGQETAASNDLRIAVTYKSANGTLLDPTSIPQGTDFYAEVKVTHPGTRPFYFEEMVIDQIFPSGWEITNTRMDGFQSVEEGDQAEYKDIRDDRVSTFFDIRQNTTRTYRVQLNAAYQGRFYLPAVSCEAMYDNTINARRPGQWVNVLGPGSI